VTEHEPDAELLARLRAADPASSLPSADPDRLAQLLEAAMSDTATRATESRATGTRDRSPLTWLVAAAAVVLIAAAGIFGMTQRDHGSSPVAQGSVTQLGFDPPRGRCQLPNVGVLKQQTVAFQGTLVSVVDGTATFEVTRWYRGGPTDTARISATPAAARHARAGGRPEDRRQLPRRRGWRHGSRLRLHPSRRRAPADVVRPGVRLTPTGGRSDRLAGVEGLLLAAGAGRRMGMPKALVSDDSGSWLQRGVATLRDGGCSRVTVVLGAEAERARALMEGLDVSVVVAEDWAQGMGASLRAGLRSLGGSADSGVVCVARRPARPGARGGGPADRRR
jgi:hypothetical protein